MKMILPVAGFLLFSALSSYAQTSTNTGPVLLAPKAIEKPKEQKPVPLAPPKMTNAVLGKPVVYGGYVTEVVRAGKKRALFDLSAPLDPQKDMENVFFHPNQDQAQPIILFRIKF